MLKNSTSSKSPWRTLGQAVLMFVMVLLVTVIGMLIASLVIRWIGGVSQWQAWSHSHYVGLLTWRCVLYAVLCCAWRKLNPWSSATTPRDRLRLLVLQAVAVLVIVIVELQKAPIDWSAF